MSGQPSQNGVGVGKKAVHVKWAGKTIALGTFSSAEADEKCARAKALTRAWRSTMRPKPSREWVMLELERLNVRSVSGRLGRKGGGEDGEDDDEGGNVADNAARHAEMLASRRDSMLSAARRDSLTAKLLSAADMARGTGVDRNNSLGWPTSDAELNSLMQRRSSSLGFSLLNDDDLNRRSSLGLGLGDMPPHRPLVGGGSAAAYEAAREDHYNKMATQKPRGDERRTSGLGMSGLAGGSMGMSVNPNQHYEMLKLHHMNLLNEIQETTLMMNLYQQQQLQQQQQQLQQAGSDTQGSNDAHLAMLIQQQQSNGNADSMFGGGQGMIGMAQQRQASMGMGMGMGGVNGGGGGATSQMQALLRQQQVMQHGGGASETSFGEKQLDMMAGHNEQQALELRLQKLKEDIARRQREAEELQAVSKSQSSGATGLGEKRKATGGKDSSGATKAIKRAKGESRQEGVDG